MNGPAGNLMTQGAGALAPARPKPAMGKRTKRARRPSQAQLERWRRRREKKAKKLLAEAEEKGLEVRDGRTYRVVSLPEKLPPKRRSAKTRYHLKDVDE